MKRTFQLFTLFTLLFTLLLAANPAIAHPLESPCIDSADRSVTSECAQFRAYLREQTKTWSDVTIPESTMQATQDEQFRETAMALENAFQSGDVDRIIEYYAEDAVSMPPGFPASVGQQAIDADLRYFFGEFAMDRDFTLVDVQVTGDTATRTGEWTQTLTPNAGGDPIVEVGRCVLGFKQVDDEWKVAWEIWNTYEPVE